MKKVLIQLLVFLFNTIKIYIVRKYIIMIIKMLDSKDYKILNSIIYEEYNIKIGKYSYGCQKIDGTIEPGTKIGSYCSIAPGVRIGGLNHPIKYVTTHPILYNDIFKYVEICDENVKSETVTIGNDVWIGFNSIILGGVTIGNGAIIAAGSVVTKDVPPYSIVGGSPARVIKYRFEKKQIEALEKIKWWDWEENKIKYNINLFKDLDKFINEHI